jgi:hypothetical protein
MSDLVNANPDRGSRALWVVLVGSVLLAVFVVVVLVPTLLVSAGIWSFGNGRFGRITHIDTSATAVVEKIRQLSRLESVNYTVDKIVEANKEAPGIPNFLAGDRMLFIAHGEVIAGVDLTQLGKNDVQVDGDSAQVHLPAAQILVTRIDNAKSRVYQRTTGLLVPADPNLESQVRQVAEEQIRQAALEDKILDKARDNARVTVTGLLYALGFKKVDVK